MTSVPKDGVIYSTSERLAEQGATAAQQLKGYSRIFILLKNSVAAFQNQPGIIQLRPKVYARIRSNNATRFTPVRGSSDVLIFIPRRDITKTKRTEVTVTKEKLRRYILVVYDPVKHEFQRRKLSRLFHRTPLIRIKPGIVLLPQIRTKRVRQYVPALFRPSEFLSRLVDLSESVEYAPRLELIGSDTHRLISQLVQSQFENRAKRIINGCRALFQELKSINNDACISTQFKKSFQRLRTQLRLLRKQAQFFNNEFGIDLTPFVNRVASAVTRVRNRLHICDT
ncbi:MAG: hypothetical protein ACFE9D_12630 [Promethearchaeota archaeon]